MKVNTSTKIVMANHTQLLEHLRCELAWEFSQGPVDFTHVRSFVSSPRLMSFCVKAFSHPSLTIGGDTFLDARTLLADYPQKTYSISIREFHKFAHLIEFVDEYSHRDTSVMKLQVWPYNPQSLDDFAMIVAVALSYTPNELKAESRLSLAIDELVGRWGFYADDF